VPFSVTVVVTPEEEVLVSVSKPLDVRAVSGLKLTVRTALCPGFSVSGKVSPESVKPEPVTVAALTVTGAVPDEVSVIDRESSDDIFTDPKFRLVALRVSLGVPAFKLSE
jgi:hypothetical protein